ncbi:hypothetical protein [Streptoalloteichus hindustanus]|uniref:Uncharacterized protein n=1 Tax=Streptoalloteichus hindustanus TaxID=2017 RepID=A0A1M4YY22_STRHI|nr:hypothetical protein [Streptoalloteichus hindustanus]SHF10457.1 hypothetical protein SAMN05444320_102524 [Streptoalloteichus hindustanus]
MSADDDEGPTKRALATLAGVAGGTVLGVFLLFAPFATVWLLSESQEGKLERLLGKVTVAGCRQAGKHLSEDKGGIKSIEGYYVGLPSDTPLDEMVSAEGLISSDFPAPGYSSLDKKDPDGTVDNGVGRIEECSVSATRYGPNRKPELDPRLSDSEWEQVRSGRLVLFQVFIMCDFRAS